MAKMNTARQPSSCWWGFGLSFHCVLWFFFCFEFFLLAAVILLDHFGFCLVGEFIALNTIQEKWQNWDKLKAVDGPWWLDENGGKGFKPSHHWDEKLFGFWFFLENSYLKQGTFGSSRVEFAQQEVKVIFLSKLTLKKGNIFKHIDFLCQPNSIPRRFLFFLC